MKMNALNTAGKGCILIGVFLLISCNNEVGVPPEITGFTPTSGFCGDTVTVDGLNFGIGVTENNVLIGSIEAEVTQSSPEELQFIIPDQAASGNIAVEARGLQTVSSSSLEVLASGAPVISGIEPDRAFPGDTIIITGENFNGAAENASVNMGGEKAVIISRTSTTMQVKVPNAETGKITIRLKGQTITSEQDFVVLIDMDQVLEDFLMTNPAVPSATMVAVKDGQIIYSHAVGLYDDAQTKEATPHTLYLTSSLAKLVVAVAIMQQVESGALDLDGDVSDYIGFEVKNPSFPNTSITTRMLMQHSAGLANPNSNEASGIMFVGYPPDSAIQLFPAIRDAVTPGSDIYFSTIWMNVEPGTLHKNSNFGITMLGYLVEKLSGMHYNDYARTRILEPLRMGASSFYYPDVRAENVAAHYSNATGQLLDPWASFFYPAGMLHTSSADWSNFLMMILNRGTHNGVQLLSEGSVDEILNFKTPANNQLAYNSNIGLVWREAPVNAGWYGHTGAGFVTHISELNPDLNLGYALFTNRGGIGVQFVGPGGSLNVEIHKWLQQQK